ncbi:MAG: alpha/beta fold hydrolase, partial [Ktedonobacterales bacterium]
GAVHYTVKGQGEPLLLVHGVYAGASSYEYRNVFDLLAQRHRVYALDLLGFGLSERPSVVYTPQLYIELIEDFARQVVGAADHPITVIASSLGAAFTMQAAVERPQLFQRLVLIEPTGIETLARQSDTLLRRCWLGFLRAPLIGEGVYNLIVSRPSIRYFLQSQAYGNREAVSDDMVDHYYTAAHQPGGRYAPASFVSGTLNTPTRTAFAMLAERGVPVLLIWGENDRFSPLSRLRGFRQIDPAVDVRVFSSGGLPQEERPQEFVEQVMVWLGERIANGSRA